MYEGRVMINYPTVKAWEELMVNSYIKSANFDIELIKMTNRVHLQVGVI